MGGVIWGTRLKVWSNSGCECYWNNVALQR